jgi:hypothetical protein
MRPQTFEGFVDADEAGRFLSLPRRRVLDMVRSRELPAHPLGSGKRKTWRFLLSELAAALTKGVFTSAHEPGIRNASSQAVDR